VLRMVVSNRSKSSLSAEKIAGHQKPSGRVEDESLFAIRFAAGIHHGPLRLLDQHLQVDGRATFGGVRLPSGPVQFGSMPASIASATVAQRRGWTRAAFMSPVSHFLHVPHGEMMTTSTSGIRGRAAREDAALRHNQVARLYRGLKPAYPVGEFQRFSVMRRFPRNQSELDIVARAIAVLAAGRVGLMLLFPLCTFRLGLLLTGFDSFFLCSSWFTLYYGAIALASSKSCFSSSSTRGRDAWNLHLREQPAELLLQFDLDSEASPPATAE